MLRRPGGQGVAKGGSQEPGDGTAQPGLPGTELSSGFMVSNSIRCLQRQPYWLRWRPWLSFLYFFLLLLLTTEAGLQVFKS